MNSKQSTQSQQTSIDKLFSVGAHFGFTKRRRHPSVIPFLYGTKDGNDIIDLQKTVGQLEGAAHTVREYAAQGKTIMYVGTKDEIKQLVKAAATRVDAPYVVNRWIGGILTNFSEIKRRIQRLLELEAEAESGVLERKYTKKERVMIGREVDKLNFNFGGIKHTTRTPDLLVIVDTRHEDIALAEATASKIPVIGIMSSDSNVRSVAHPIVMNDGLQGSVKFALEVLTDAHKVGVSEHIPAAPVASSGARTRRPAAPRA